MLRVKAAGSVLRCIQNISLHPTVLEPLLGGATCCTCSESIRSRNRALGIQICIPGSCHPQVSRLETSKTKDRGPREAVCERKAEHVIMRPSDTGTSSAKAARSSYHAIRRDGQSLRRVLGFVPAPHRRNDRTERRMGFLESRGSWEDIFICTPRVIYCASN